MLAHEAWFTSMHPRTPDIHSSAAAAARVATNAEVDRLALIHLPPFQESVQSLLEEARAQGPETIAAVDGTAFSDVAI
jgi:ribonuclease BN (tRNA processing enzyme)